MRDIFCGTSAVPVYELSLHYNGPHYITTIVFECININLSFMLQPKLLCLYENNLGAIRFEHSTTLCYKDIYVMQGLVCLLE